VVRIMTSPSNPQSIHRGAIPERSHAATLFLALERIHASGFAVEAVPTAAGTTIVRARPVIARVDRPATLRLSNGICVERDSYRDALAQVLQVVTTELDLDELERRGAAE
jgi:hypothetical protein